MSPFGLFELTEFLIKPQRVSPSRPSAVRVSKGKLLEIQNPQTPTLSLHQESRPQYTGITKDKLIDSQLKLLLNIPTTIRLEHETSIDTDHSGGLIAMINEVVLQ
jgi:hypothetical protein